MRRSQLTEYGDWELGERSVTGLPDREQESHQSIEQALDYALACNGLAGIRLPNSLKPTPLP